jgi:hypothetical protein
VRQLESAVESAALTANGSVTATHTNNDFIIQSGAVERGRKNPTPVHELNGQGKIIAARQIETDFILGTPIMMEPA